MGTFRDKSGFTINEILEVRTEKDNFRTENDIDHKEDRSNTSIHSNDSHFNGHNGDASASINPEKCPYYGSLPPQIPFYHPIFPLRKFGWYDTPAHGTIAPYCFSEQYNCALDGAYQPHISCFYPHSGAFPGMMLSTSSSSSSSCMSKRKGGQIRFTSEQTKSLEHKFANVKYLAPEDRRLLAIELKLSDRQVKTWFQNRRAKWRRLHDSTCSPSSPDTSQSIPNLSRINEKLECECNEKTKCIKEDGNNVIRSTISYI